MLTPLKAAIAGRLSARELDRVIIMSNNTAKAVVASVDIGFTKIDGLMLPDGSYCVAVPQLANVFQFDKNQASRTIKGLLDKGFQFDTAKSELHPKSVNVIKLDQVGQIIYRLAKKGNPIADAFMQAILQEGLERRFDKAFDKKVSEDEYNALVALRMKRILARKLWTDTLRDRSMTLYGTKPTPGNYRNWTIKVNERLFSKRHFQCNRDNMNQLEQEAIELFERMAERKAKLHLQATPDQLVEMALASFE